MMILMKIQTIVMINENTNDCDHFNENINDCDHFNDYISMPEN